MKNRSRFPLLASLVLSSLMAVSLTQTIAQARTWDAINKSGKIIVVTEGAFAPFNFYEGKKLTGFEVELAEAVIKEMGFRHEWKVVPFDGQIAAIRQGRFDFAIASHGFTAERAKSIDYGHYHYCTGGQIGAFKDGPLTVKSLAGKVIGVQLATSYADNAQKIAGVKEVKTYGKDTEAFQALRAKRTEAWITDRFLLKETLQKNGDANIVAGELVFQEEVGAIFKKNDLELINAYNKALDRVKEKGVYAKLSQKYFGEDVSCK